MDGAVDEHAASYSARQSTPAFQSSPTSTGTIGVTIVLPEGLLRPGRLHRRRARRTPEAELVQPVGAVARRSRARARSSSAPSAERITRNAASAAPSAAGTPEAVKRNGRETDPQVLDHLRRAGDEAAAGGERLGEGAHPQVHALLDAEQLRGAGAARAEHADAVRLVDHQPRAVALAEPADVTQRRDVALHREDAVDDHEHAAAVAPARVRASSRACPCGCAGRAAASRARAAAVEDRGVVAGVDDHGVAGPEQRAERADVRLMAGGERRSRPRFPSTRRARAPARGATAWCRSAAASRSAGAVLASASRAPASPARRRSGPR